jgi:aquaporin Z
MNEKVRLGVAEFIGTAILVIGGPGAAIIAGKEIGLLGVSLAFGLSLLCAAYFIGSISGCHINPAVTFGLWVVGKTKSGDVPWYLGGQILGGIFGAAVIFVIASGLSGFSASDSGFASNGWGDHSPSAVTARAGGLLITKSGYNFGAMAVTEIVLTALFVLVVVSTSRKSMPVGFTGLAVGLMLTLVHLVSIPVDNTSVNPARSLATAIFQGGWALEQLWAFFVFPLIGGIVGGFIWKVLVPADDA